RGYGQHDPLVEYKRESFEMFEDMMRRFQEETVRYLYLMQVLERPSGAFATAGPEGAGPGGGGPEAGVPVPRSGSGGGDGRRPRPLLPLSPLHLARRQGFLGSNRASATEPSSSALLLTFAD